MKYIFVLNATMVGGGGEGQGLYDKYTVLYILNVTISIMLLYLLLDNLKNDDQFGRFCKYYCIFRMYCKYNSVCRKYSCHIMEATRFEVVNSFARFGICVLMLT